MLGERRLAGAVLSDQSDELAVIDAQGHAVERKGAAGVGETNLLDLEKAAGLAAWCGLRRAVKSSLACRPACHGVVCRADRLDAATAELCLRVADVGEPPADT